MIKFLRKRFTLFLLASVLVGLILVIASHRVAAQGGFGDLCDPSMEDCDDGSGDFGSGGDSGGDASLHHCKTVPDGCIDWGCKGNPGHYTCVLSKNDTNPFAVCNSGGPCD